MVDFCTEPDLPDMSNRQEQPVGIKAREWVGNGRVMTMEAGVKIAAAGSVLLGGVLGAMLFRHDAPGARLTVTGSTDRLVLQKQVHPSRLAGPVSGGYGGRSQLPFLPSASGKTGGQAATILTPTVPGEAPPALERDYPGAGSAVRSGWGTSIELPDATRPVRASQTHKIVDGDTLGVLAERYLGSADRYLEIFRANRDRLTSPELLPIGVELKIPPLGQRPPRSGDRIRRRSLVPIPGRSAGEE